MTAREDQLQLGTCDRLSHGGRHVFSQQCWSWIPVATEDQPQLGTCDRDSDPHTKNYHLQVPCISWKPLIGETRAAHTGTMPLASASVSSGYVWLTKSGVEAGAHPSQDARESEADEEIAKLLNIITQLQEDLMRARSTPSLPVQDARTREQEFHAIIAAPGTPTNPSQRLPMALYSRYRAGDTVEFLAGDYELPWEQIHWGIRIGYLLRNDGLRPLPEAIERSLFSLLPREEATRAAHAVRAAITNWNELSEMAGGSTPSPNRYSSDKVYEVDENGAITEAAPSPDPPQPVQREEWDETVEEWMNHALKEMCLVARSGCKHKEYMTHTDGFRQPLILAMGRCLGYGLAEVERLREALREAEEKIQLLEIARRQQREIAEEWRRTALAPSPPTKEKALGDLGRKEEP